MSEPGVWATVPPRRVGDAIHRAMLRAAAGARSRAAAKALEMARRAGDERRMPQHSAAASSGHKGKRSSGKGGSPRAQARKRAAGGQRAHRLVSRSLGSGGAPFGAYLLAARDTLALGAGPHPDAVVQRGDVEPSLEMVNKAEAEVQAIVPDSSVGASSTIDAPPMALSYSLKDQGKVSPTFGHMRVRLMFQDSAFRNAVAFLVQQRMLDAERYRGAMSIPAGVLRREVLRDPVATYLVYHVMDAAKPAPGIAALSRMTAKRDKKIEQAVAEISRLEGELSDLRGTRARDTSHVAAVVVGAQDEEEEGGGGGDLSPIPMAQAHAGPEEADTRAQNVKAGIEAQRNLIAKQRSLFRSKLAMFTSIKTNYAPPVAFSDMAAREHKKARSERMQTRRDLKRAVKAAMRQFRGGRAHEPGRGSSLKSLGRESTRYELAGGSADVASDSDDQLDDGDDQESDGYDPSNRNDPDEYLSQRRSGRKVVLEHFTLPNGMGSVHSNMIKTWNDPDVYVHIPHGMPTPHASTMTTDAYLPLSCRAVPAMFARLAGATARATYFRAGSGRRGAPDQHDVSNAIDTEEVRKRQECRAALGTPSALDVLFLLDSMTNRYVLPIGGPSDMRILNEMWDFTIKSRKATHEMEAEEKAERQGPSREEAGQGDEQDRHERARSPERSAAEAEAE